MKQVAVGILVLVLAAVGTLALFAREAPAFVEPSGSTRPQLSQATLVQARGRVVPSQSATLSFPSRGMVPEVFVAEVLVKPGDTVQQGDVLARLDTRDLKLRVEAARAVLEQAQREYDRLLAGPTPEEVAVAQAQLAQAQAHARAVHGSVTAEDVAAAQADLERSRTDLSVLETNTRSARLRAAQAALALAQARLQAQRDKLSAEKTSAQLRMEQAANDLRNRQDAYSRVVWENQARGDKVDQQHKDLEAAALRAVQDAEKALQEATVKYEQAKQAEIAGVAAAEAEVSSAQAALDALLANADAGEAATARAEMAQAVANLSRLQGEQRAGTLDAAAAEEAIAQAKLQLLMAPPRAEDVAIAQARVREAEIALQREEVIMELAELRAPFAGTVVKVNLNVGEVPTSGAPGIILADLSSWLIETEDLTEQSVVQVREGDPVVLTFDAIPGLTLPGKVTRVDIRGQSGPENRYATYTVVITPDRLDKRLRWNLSAAVRIEPRS
ncbi:MAG TPA: HlyD family efflux transporter periplasmic adaptor subunit [Roseiflexaceae bacterium]|nr:HlyD family efflux transporter periplasmic adaptor subunit [Roseiflexaceae bacterium]